MQIPHFTEKEVKIANKFGINDIYEFMDAMDPEENKNYGKLMKGLGFTNRQLADAANFTNNKYPNVEMEFEVEEPEEIVAGAPSYLKVTVQRQLEEDEELDTVVHAPFYPSQKTQNWWLVVGNDETKALCAIKRVTIGRQLSVRLEYVVPAAGKQQLTLFLMSDSYLGADQVQQFEVTAQEGEEDDEEEEEEKEEEEDDDDDDAMEE
jgi:pre-mRNA-splicing helicase BRR2